MPDHLHALPAGHQLGEYRIDHVLGSGGFGITYYALDIHLNKPVAIKEYLPNDFALRTDAITVKPKSTADQNNYQWGLDRFLAEAQALACFEHPHLNKVHRFFQDNNTAYIVLEYIDGETLSQVLKREGRLDAPRLQRLLEELLSGLEKVHAADYVHRDIKPGNIMLRQDGSAVLLDFGAARPAIGTRSKSITSILTPGYAPIEQYDQKAEYVGPWSDLYALGMVAYCCVSGIGDSEVPDAVARADMERRGEKYKDLVSAVSVGEGRYDESLLRAVDWCIEIYEEQRPRSVSALRAVMDGGVSAERPAKAPSGSAPAEPTKLAAVAASPPGLAVSGGKRKWIVAWGLVALVGVVAAGAGGWDLVKESLYWSRVSCGEEIEVRRYQQAYPGGRYQSEAETCLADEKNRKEEAARLAAEVEKKRKEEAARLAAEVEKKRKEEAARLAAEAEKKRKEEAARLAAEAEKKRKEEAARLAAEAEKKRKAEKARLEENRRFTATFGREVSPDAINADGFTDLHYAALANMPGLVKVLLDAGAEINARTYEDGKRLSEISQKKLRELTKSKFGVWKRNGRTPLHFAALENARKAANLLIARGADVNAKADGTTPLHTAAYRNARDVADLLIAHGADVNAKDKDGVTPLGDAAYRNARDAADLLIARGADVNAKSKYDNTPLHLAAWKNARDVADLLIARGADVNVKNNWGDTPRDVAENHGHLELARLLR